MSTMGIDTGATYTRFWDGINPIVQVRTPLNYDAYLSTIRGHLVDLQPIERLVIALPTLLENQAVLKGPNLGDGWEGCRLDYDVQDLLLDGSKVRLVEDTEAAGYGVQQSQLQNNDPTILITLSTGVGSALITTSAVKSLQAGHMPLNLSKLDRLCGCGQRGCVEADLSGTAIWLRSGIAAEELNDSSFWREYGMELGGFLLNLTCLFRLRQILLMGGVTHRYDEFVESAREVLTKQLKLIPVPDIMVSSLGDNTGVVGAYWLAKNL